MRDPEMLSVREYADRYVGGLSSVWQIEPVADGYRVRFPNGGSRVVERTGIDWSEPFATDHVSSTLWFQTLTYAPYFLIDFDDREMTSLVFSSYAAQLRQARSSVGYREINSLDHAHAAQLLAASATMGVLLKGEGDEGLAQVLVDFVEAVAESALSEGMIRHNNHGVMLTRALAHVGFVFEGRTSMAGECGARGAKEFDAIVQGAFDPRGIVNENTPAYQILWLRLVEAMADFTDIIGDPYGFVDSWRRTLELGKESLGLLLMPGGRVPSIGDDAGGQSPYPSRDGELVSTENGVYVLKNGDFYLSITSGYRGVVHKHPDDTSLRLQVSGQDLLIDAGLLNYDHTDDVGVSIVSQRGHTGLYFRRFDDLRPVDIFTARAPRQTSSMSVVENADGSTSYACEYVFDDIYRARRTYTRYGHDSLLIEDAFEAPNDEVAVQRFLIPKEARMSFHGSKAIAEFDGLALEIRVEEDSTIAVFNGHAGRGAKGWRAVRHYEAEPCWCLEVEPRSGSRSMRATLSVVVPDEPRATGVVDAFWSGG